MITTACIAWCALHEAAWRSLCAWMSPTHPTLVSYSILLPPNSICTPKTHECAHLSLWNKLLLTCDLLWLPKLQECFFTCTLYFMTQNILKIPIFCKGVFPIPLLWWRECLEVRHKSSTCWGKRTNQIKWADAVLKALIFNWLPFSQPSLNCWALLREVPMLPELAESSSASDASLQPGRSAAHMLMGPALLSSWSITDTSRYPVCCSPCPEV